MSSSYKFEKPNDLINFLYDSKQLNNEFVSAFDNWEITFISVKIAQGLELSLNTKTVDSSGVNEYQTWKNVKPIVRSYLSQNISQEFSNVSWYDRMLLQIGKLDIRLRCPRDLKNRFDPSLQYDSFRLNFVIDSGIYMAMANSVEKVFPVDKEPFSDWNQYVSDIYEKWKKDNNK